MTTVKTPCIDIPVPEPGMSPTARPFTTDNWQAAFDERLLLARIGIDTVIEHRHGAALAEAQQAATDAQQAVTEAAELLAVPEPQFKPNRVLAEAARVIERRGWHRGSWEAAPGGAVCAMRAIDVAVQSLDGRGAFIGALDELLNRIAIDTGKCLSVPMWNDRCADVSQVIRLLY